MKPNKLWHTMLFNWPVKVFSLLLAISIYLVVNYATLDQRTVEIPLHVILPDAFVATSTVPESVTLKIKADERYIGMVDSSAIKATVDYSMVDTEGVSSAPVVLMAQPSYFDIEVSFSTDPETIRIYFQKSEMPAPVEANQELGGITL